MSEQNREPESAEERPSLAGLTKFLIVLAEAYVATAHLKPRARARGFVNTADEIVAARLAITPLYPVKPSPRRAAEAEAWREADELYREVRPALLARLPPEWRIRRPR